MCCCRYLPKRVSEGLRSVVKAPDVESKECTRGFGLANVADQTTKARGDVGVLPGDSFLFAARCDMTSCLTYLRVVLAV